MSSATLAPAVFRPFPFLSNPHVQTLVGHFLRGLYQGDGSLPTSQGVVFVIGFGYPVVPEGHARLLLAYLPDMVADIITPLRAAGYGAAEIAALGDVRGI